MIKLYSTNCPKCKVLEVMLDSRMVQYEKIEDEKEVIRVGTENNIMAAPILKVNDEYMDFSAAVKYVKNNE